GKVVLVPVNGDDAGEAVTVAAVEKAAAGVDKDEAASHGEIQAINLVAISKAITLTVTDVDDAGGAVEVVKTAQRARLVPPDKIRAIFIDRADLLSVHNVSEWKFFGSMAEVPSKGLSK
ncbi:MAG: hypothetical protein CMO33_04980, partial [Verrucomicrobia bacterium]|nr:hypothetical protein [Verrucomicrobiota bacterium]